MFAATFPRPARGEPPKATARNAPAGPLRCRATDSRGRRQPQDQHGANSEHGASFRPRRRESNDPRARLGSPTRSASIAMPPASTEPAWTVRLGPQGAHARPPAIRSTMRADAAGVDAELASAGDEADDGLRIACGRQAIAVLVVTTFSGRPSEASIRVRPESIATTKGSRLSTPLDHSDHGVSVSEPDFRLLRALEHLTWRPVFSTGDHDLGVTIGSQNDSARRHGLERHRPAAKSRSPGPARARQHHAAGPACPVQRTRIHHGQPAMRCSRLHP